MKIMKIVHIAVCLLGVFASIACAKADGVFSTLMIEATAATKTITLSDSQILRIEHFMDNGYDGNQYCTATVTKDGVTSFFARSDKFNSQSIRYTGATVVGPAVISISNGNPPVQFTGLISYSIRNNLTAETVLVPSNAVVIPADSSGPISIILESSTDLVSWSAAQPGSYLGSTTKRFFRVRAIQN